MEIRNLSLKKSLLFLVVIFVALLQSAMTVQAAETATTTTATTTIPDQAEVEAKVREEFSDVPAMVEIARCESKFRQFTDSGNVFYGGYDNNMIGVFQFYESVHKSTADSLGYDLSTLEGNMDYARHLYQAEGLTPWNSSKSCWENASVENETSANTEPDVAELENKIKLLQKIVELLMILIELKAQASLS